MPAEWFRNETWNAEVEQAFDAKLRRARRKEQYLRIQACYLTRTHPEVALRLLERYFQLPDDFDHAQAHVDRAQALLTLGRVEEAVASYEAALAREAAFPNLLTQAYLELPSLIVAYGKRERYDRALEILRENEHRLTFPVDRFLCHAARAQILADRGDASAAKAEAQQAIQAAAVEHSGFRNHPSVGLVTKDYDRLVTELQTLAST